jgi:hypothetical protein
MLSWSRVCAKFAPDCREWSKNQQAVQEADRIASFGVVRCDVHRVMHRDWGLHLSRRIFGGRWQTIRVDSRKTNPGDSFCAGTSCNVGHLATLPEAGRS